ncbi:MAG: hypothetical protein ACK41F_00070 [Fimbriimonadaceae bacterium]
MVARVIVLLSAVLWISGCGQPARNLEAEQTQPPADLEAGKSAKTIEEWARANPNNGLPGSGEDGGK